MGETTKSLCAMFILCRGVSRMTLTSQQSRWANLRLCLRYSEEVRTLQHPPIGEETHDGRPPRALQVKDIVQQSMLVSGWPQASSAWEPAVHEELAEEAPRVFCRLFPLEPLTMLQGLRSARRSDLHTDAKISSRTIMQQRLVVAPAHQSRHMQT
eukprot:5742918-Amphidinium_carterae.3